MYNLFIHVLKGIANIGFKCIFDAIWINLIGRLLLFFFLL